MKRKGIVWFRSDLRLHDNEALTEAMRACDEVIPVYVFDPRVFMAKTRYGFAKTGVHRARFIIQCVESLRGELRKRGADLMVRIGKPEQILFDLASTHKTNWVFCNRERTREEVEVQDALEKRLWSIGQEMRYERGKMLLYTQDLPFPVTHTPDSYSVFKKDTEHFVEIRKPLPVPDTVPLTLAIDPGQIPGLQDLGHHLEEDENVVTYFVGGEPRGLALLSSAISNRASSTEDLNVANPLSPWISQGCLSPKLIYEKLVGSDFLQASNELIASLLWRDYLRLMGKKYKDLIFQRGGPIRSVKAGIDNVQAAQKWLQAETGIDMIDACLMQLRLTGYLSHKGRMLVASYFVNEMNINWQIGASFFESLLLDYDPCSNYGNWNLIAGVAADTSKERYPSIDSQIRRLDQGEDYINKWLINRRLQGQT